MNAKPTPMMTSHTKKQQSKTSVIFFKSKLQDFPNLCLEGLN